MTGGARVLHVVGDSGFGGGARVILAIAGAQREAGYQVDVLTTDASFASAAEAAGLGVVDLDVIRRPIRPVFDLIGSWRLARWLKGHPYDAVHTHTSKAGIAGRWAADRADIPVIVHTVHGFAFHEATQPVVIKGVSILERWAARKADAIVTVSEFHRDWAQSLGIAAPPVLLAIPNGIDPARVEPARTRDEVRTELEAGESDLVVVSQGRVVPGKGLEALLEATDRLVSAGVPVRLLIVGDGSLRTSLEEDARNRGLTGSVVFTGFQEQVGDYLAAADLVALPSKREGMSIALLEAMAAGRAIVTSRVTSAPEVTDHGRVARLVDPEDPDVLVMAIGDLAPDPDERAHLGAAAKARFSETYTEEHMVQAYADLYEHLGVPTPGLGSEMLVRALTPRDGTACGDLHVRAFPNFFLTALGRRFLGRFYRSVLSEPAASGWGAYVDGELVAFAVGAETAGGFYRRVLRRGWWSMGWAALPKLLTDPRRIAHLARSFDLQSDEDGDHPVLLSICTDPVQRGGGAGRSVLGALERDLAARCGSVSISLITDADENDGVLAFYDRNGWEPVGEVIAGERRMIRLEKPLTTVP